jgi:hypothetical protein
MRYVEASANNGQPLGKRLLERIKRVILGSKVIDKKVYLNTTLLEGGGRETLGRMYWSWMP